MSFSCFKTFKSFPLHTGKSLSRPLSSVFSLLASFLFSWRGAMLQPCFRFSSLSIPVSPSSILYKHLLSISSVPGSKYTVVNRTGIVPAFMELSCNLCFCSSHHWAPASSSPHPYRFSTHLSNWTAPSLLCPGVFSKELAFHLYRMPPSSASFNQWLN